MGSLNIPARLSTVFTVYMYTPVYIVTRHCLLPIELDQNAGEYQTIIIVIYWLNEMPRNRNRQK